jgi:hypothetical protein
MALTLTNRREGVTSDGRRSVDFTATFSNGDASDITLATLGLQNADEVWVKVAAASGIAVDITADDSSKITLDPSAAGAPTIRVIGS